VRNIGRSGYEQEKVYSNGDRAKFNVRCVRYRDDSSRQAGTGLVEEFREFVLELLDQQDEWFQFFHAAVAPNSVQAIRQAIENCTDIETSRWLPFYLK